MSKSIRDQSSRITVTFVFIKNYISTLLLTIGSQLTIHSSLPSDCPDKYDDFDLLYVCDCHASWAPFALLWRHWTVPLFAHLPTLPKASQSVSIWSDGARSHFSDRNLHIYILIISSHLLFPTWLAKKGTEARKGEKSDISRLIAQ